MEGMPSGPFVVLLLKGAFTMTTEDRYRAVVDYLDGKFSQHQIAARLGVSQSTVSNWVRRSGAASRSVGRRADKSTAPTGMDERRYRIVHPTVAYWMSNRIPAHELEEL